jgi:hypothetical protein
MASNIAGTATQAADSSVVECPTLASFTKSRQRQMPARLKARRYGRVAAVCFVREIATSGSGGTTMGNSAG